MRSFNMKKTLGPVLAAFICASSLTATLPVSIAESSEDVIYETGFEDGDVSAFTNRGENDTTVLSATDEMAHSGSYSLLASGRSATWNGPAFRLDDKCEAGEQYLVSAAVCGKYYTDVTASLQYTDSSGGVHYTNLSHVSQSEWVEFTDMKVCFSDDVTDVYVYFEGGTDDLYVDDFSVKAAEKTPIENDIPSLKNVYKDYFKVGTAVTTMELAPNTTKDLIRKHFNSITLGNELKPESILDREATAQLGNYNDPQVNLASARPILNFCRDNNISVRGHVLVWHSQTPDWFFKEEFADDGEWVDKETMLVRMENYIKNVFAAIEEEYPTVDFYAWDVVNEAWSDSGEPRKPGEQGANGSSDSAWVKVFGDNSFIEYAFTYARKYAPEGTKLYYNDYNEYIEGKTNAIYDMAMSLKEKGLIDGIGMQAHLDVGFPTPQQFEKALDKFASTGLDVQITELDITTTDTSEAGFEKQAEIYGKILESCRKYADSISAVVFWGTTDDHSWRADKYPLLFNADYTAKPAYYAIIDGLEIPDETTTEPQTEQPTDTTGEPTESTEATEKPTEEATEESTNVTGTTGEATETTTSAPADETHYGDATCDGSINVEDVVMILSYTVDPNGCDITPEGMNNSDVYQRGDGINSSDAASVQKLIVKIIPSLPES